MFSPIPITEFMSWVLMMVVIPYSFVIPESSSSMTSDVFGSSPEFGSSQKRYLGLSTMARAMATRFCMPPEISAGYLFCASRRLTRSRHSWARRSRSRLFIGANISSGKRTFSSTVSESKSAEPWNTMPISRRSSTLLFLSIESTSRPSKSTSPLVGVSSPTRFFISTVFPEPL